MAETSAKDIKIGLRLLALICLSLPLAAAPLAQQPGEPKPSFDVSGWSTWIGLPWEPVFMRGYLAVAVQSALAGGRAQTPETPTTKPVLEISTVLEEAAPIEAGAGPWAELDLSLYQAATAPIPAGIPASRQAEREAARAVARETFSTELAGPRGALWKRYLEERLRYGHDRPGAWSAAAALVVDLQYFDLADALATGLTAPEASLVNQVAHGAVAELYGREFESLADYQAFTDGLVPTGASLRLIEELRAERERSRKRLLELFNYNRAAAIEHLGDPDYKTRLGAAEVVAAALHDGLMSVDEVLPALLDRAAVERWPAVAEVLLDAAVSSLDGRPAGDALVERLRGELDEGVRKSSDGLELLMARALARLPWPAALAAAPTSLPHGAGLISALLRRVTAAEDRADPDVTLGVLLALDALCIAAGDDLETSTLLATTEVRLPLLALAFGDRRETAARVVAVGILPRVAPADGLLDLIRLVSAERSARIELPTSLRFAAMGAMGRFANRGDAAAAGLGELATCLVENVARPEADLRRRALELLGDEALEAELKDRSMTLFISRLGVEEEPDLQAELVSLIGRYGGSEDLEGILALGNFDQLAARDPGFGGLIERLAGGQPELVFESAERLWNVKESVGQWARRASALGLVARLSSEAAATLTPAQHRTVANWAIRLRDAGVSLAATMPGGAQFLERLVELHLPRSGSSEPFGLAEQNLMAALFLSDLAAARGNGEAARLKDAVLAKFARAEELAADHPTAEFTYLVRRSRARFLVASGAPVPPAALADYLFVFDSDFRRLLDAADLRGAGQLADASEDPGHVAEAWRFSEALVAHVAWPAEPAAVRLEDLRQLGARALASGDMAVLSAAKALFDGLPKDDGTASPTVSKGKVWAGLIAEGASLKELAGIAVGLAEASRKLAEAATRPAPKEPAPAPAPSPSEDKQPAKIDAVQTTAAPSR